MKTLPAILLMFFAAAASAESPPGWIVAGTAPADYEFGVDATQASDGQKSAYILAKPSSSSGFGTLMQTVTADNYRGGRWKLSARMRTRDARKAQMWMRVDGPDRRTNAFDNMDDRAASGDTEWTRYEIVLDVAPDSIAVAFGFFLVGGGEAWADDFKLERVSSTTPLTGKAASELRTPLNMSFEQ